MNFKRKKTSRMHGKTTHGWGAKKKRRGSGNKGGKGFAGSGKRADSKKPSYWHDTEYFGKHGFIKKNIPIITNAINIIDIEDKIETWLIDKLIEKKDSHYIIDLENLGYNKLLSRGSPKNKVKLTVMFASDNALKNAKSGGWEITLTGKKKEPKPAKEVKKEVKKEAKAE